MHEEGIAGRISLALSKQEGKAEQFANSARLTLFVILSCVALVNARSVSLEANVLNIGTLLVGYAYGLVVFVMIRRSGYFPALKYFTSCFVRSLLEDVKAFGQGRELDDDVGVAVVKYHST